jgi:hypothetical protein
MAIYYLDVDDEITSAAQRIRESGDRRIALVVQPGSRLATSRINFRLLAREARHRNRRLAIVAADPAIRSLAQTAGLPVFETVAEYQRSEAGPRIGAADATTAALDELAETVDRPGSRAAGGGGAGASPRSGSSEGPAVRMRQLGSSTSARPSRVSGLPAVLPFGLTRGAIGMGVVAALLVVALAGYVLLPGASVKLTLRGDPLGPVTFTALVDPGVTSIDPGTNTVPAASKTFPVTAQGTFKATGQNVVETAAIGKVTFTSTNTYLAVPILAGTQVSTDKGIAFATTENVMVPKATVSGLQIKPGTVDVGVVAVVKGTAGNVAAGAIDKVPAELAAALVYEKPVTNKSATTGGTHTVTLYVQQSDVDAAEASLGDQLEAAFRQKLADPAMASADTALFAPGAHLGPASYSPDPTSLLGHESDEFDLSASSTATALSASSLSLEDLAATKMAPVAKAGYDLVEGSISLSFGSAATSGGGVSVPVTARALQVPAVDVAAIKAAIRGMSPADAEAYLSRYGTAQVSLWPFWASSVPGFDFRIDVDVEEPRSAAAGVSPGTAKATPGHASRASPSSSPSASPGPARSPTPEPTPSPEPTPPPSSSPTAGPSETASP